MQAAVELVSDAVPSLVSFFFVFNIMINLR